MHDKASNIAKNPKFNGYQHGFASMVYNFFDKKTSGSGIKNENMAHQCPLDLATEELPGELHKLIIRK